VSGSSDLAEDHGRLPRHLRGVPIPPGASLAALQARYGTDHVRWGVGVVAALVIVPFLAWVVWAGYEQTHQDLHWQTIGFSDVSDESVTLRFQVFLPAEETAQCTVRALDLHGVEVGRAQVPVHAESTSATVVYALPVTARPSSAFVESCRLTD
jgi:hypothetical protein